MELNYEVWDTVPKWSNEAGAMCYATASYGSTIISVQPSDEPGISVKMTSYLENTRGRYGAVALVFLGPDTPKTLLSTPYHLKGIVTVVLNVLQRQPNFKIGVYHLTPSSALPDIGNKVAHDIVERIKEMRHGQPTGERRPLFQARSSWN